MTRLDVMEKLTEIFRDIFNDEELNITEETVPDDIEEWDSIGHVYMITEVEDEFGIDLSKESGNIVDVCCLVDTIMSKLNK